MDEIAAAPELRLIVLIPLAALANAQPAYDINSPWVRTENPSGAGDAEIPLGDALGRTLSAIERAARGPGLW